MTGAFDRWELRRRAARESGGAERVERHRSQGKMTARERLEAFFDAGTFVELDAFVTHRATGS